MAGPQPRGRVASTPVFDKLLDKLLGFVVWQGGKLYVRRRLHRAMRKAALAGLGALVIVGAVVLAQRRSSSE